MSSGILNAGELFEVKQSNLIASISAILALSTRRQGQDSSEIQRAVKVKLLFMRKTLVMVESFLT